MRKLLLIIILFIGVKSTAQTPLYKLLRGTKTLLYDTFTDANGTLLDAHAMDKGSGWTLQQNGICGGITSTTIQSNRAIAGINVLPIATANAGVSDYVASVDLIVPNSNNYLSGICFRFNTCTDFWMICIERDAGGTPYLAIIDRNTSVLTYRATVNVPAATNSTLNIKVILNGSSITAVAGTGETCNYTSSFLASQTAVGLIGYDDSGSYSPSIPTDNFLVLKL